MKNQRNLNMKNQSLIRRANIKNKVNKKQQKWLISKLKIFQFTKDKISLTVMELTKMTIVIVKLLIQNILMVKKNPNLRMSL